MEKGKFITIEGVDGCGKTTLVKKLQSDIMFKDFVFTREPGGDQNCSKIRELILSVETKFCALTELMLFAADRIEHLNGLIVPSLNNGKNVISDRYADSNLAYQGYGRKLPIDEVKTIVEHSKAYLETLTNDTHVVKTLNPDRTIFLDVEPDYLAYNRRKQLGSDAIEKEGLAMQNRIYLGFKDIIKQDPNRFIQIDAKNSPDEVYHEACEAIKQIIKR